AVLGSTSGLLAQPGVGTRIAEATAILGSARSWHASVVADAWQVVVDGGELDAPARDLVALASIHAARSAARAVDLVHELAGTSVARMSSRLGRCWRDVHVVASHVGLSPLSLEGIGQRAGSSESVRTPEHLHRAQDRR
ncbi:MAG: hypothetical protein ACKVVT_04710, partial [Dehalococcoidia bacterium]